MQELSVVRGTPEDWEQYRGLWLEFFRNSTPVDPTDDPTTWPEEMWRERLTGMDEDRTFTFALASPDGEWHSMASAYVDDSAAPITAYVRESISVARNLEERGALTAPLLKVMLEHALDLKVLRVYAAFEENRTEELTLLRRAGFADTGVTRPSGIDESGPREVELCLDLTPLHLQRAASAGIRRT